jgi:hypothetical protein
MYGSIMVAFGDDAFDRIVKVQGFGVKLSP